MFFEEESKENNMLLHAIVVTEAKRNSVGFACHKQSVYTMLASANSDKYYFGTNNVEQYKESCPRDEQNFKSGEGYHLCKEECNNNHTPTHAEHDVILNALKDGCDVRDAVIVMVGHTYCCDGCIKLMKEYGINSVQIINSDYTISSIDLNKCVVKSSSNENINEDDSLVEIQRCPNCEYIEVEDDEYEYQRCTKLYGSEFFFRDFDYKEFGCTLWKRKDK